jgi:AcrR family transcriptional regulator
MMVVQTTEEHRQRAPSARALATKARVFDAAEKVFSERGFDGSSIRDIAAEAGEPVGTIHHHGGGKAALFHRTVLRRAEALSSERLQALEQARSEGALTLEAVLAAFIRPFFELSEQEPRWRNYARLVAFVSVDDRWRGISAQCFDPTAEAFLDEILKLSPHASRSQVAEGFVFSVSAMLALLTSRERIGALGAGLEAEHDQIDHLIRFCAAGLRGKP